MSSSDYLIRAITKDNAFRIYAVRTTNLTEEARGRHNLSHTSAVVLGRAMACGILLCFTLRKSKGHLTLKIKGDGPIGSVIVDASNEGTVRGYVNNPQLEVFDTNNYVDVDKAVGKIGYVHVSYDREFGLPYQGTVEIVSGEIVNDVVNYLGRSEQIPSFISAGVYLEPKTGKVLHSGGVLIQALPGASESDINDLEESVSKLDPFSILLRSGLTLDQLIQKAIPDKEIEIVSEFEGLCFHCGCSQKKFEDAIYALEKSEIKKIIDTVGFAEGKCHFCNNVYLIDNSTLERYLKE